MKTNQTGINLIKQFEGLRLAAYYDSVGVLSIGYGHTGKDVTPGKTITLAEAERLLRDDLIYFETGVSQLVKVRLTANQFAALVSFSYNVGLTALKESTLLRKLNAKDYQGAADELLRWNKAGGKPLLGLTRRREAERSLFLKP